MIDGYLTCAAILLIKQSPTVREKPEGYELPRGGGGNMERVTPLR